MYRQSIHVGFSYRQTLPKLSLTCNTHVWFSQINPEFLVSIVYMFICVSIAFNERGTGFEKVQIECYQLIHIRKTDTNKTFFFGYRLLILIIFINSQTFFFMLLL